MRTATSVPTSIALLPSLLAVQWNGTIRVPHRTAPSPRGSSNSATVPSTVVAPTGTKSSGPAGSEGVMGTPSMDDLGQGELDDVGGTPVPQRRDEHVDLRLADHGLHGEAATAEQFGHRR